MWFLEFHHERVGTRGSKVFKKVGFTANDLRSAGLVDSPLAALEMGFAADARVNFLEILSFGT